MTLGEKQELFTHWFVRLVIYAESLGFGVVINEVTRGEQQALWNSQHCKYCKKELSAHGGTTHTFSPIGIYDTLHRKRLAGDLLLFTRRQDGKRLYLDKEQHYTKLGTWWKKQHPLFRWGGDFPGDPGHFSIEHGGRK